MQVSLLSNIEYVGGALSDEGTCSHTGGSAHRNSWASISCDIIFTIARGHIMANRSSVPRGMYIRVFAT